MFGTEVAVGSKVICGSGSELVDVRTCSPVRPVLGSVTTGSLFIFLED